MKKLKNHPPSQIDKKALLTPQGGGRFRDGMWTFSHFDTIQNTLQ